MDDAELDEVALLDDALAELLAEALAEVLEALADDALLAEALVDDELDEAGFPNEVNTVSVEYTF